jgi:hypothetical protein
VKEKWLKTQEKVAPPRIRRKIKDIQCELLQLPELLR